MIRFSIIWISALLITGCQHDDRDCYQNLEPKRNDDLVTIKQGIWGDIWYWEGDFMPMCPSGTIYPVERTIYVFEVANRFDVERDGYGPFYSKIHTKLIDSVLSEPGGFFQIELDTGSYSLFVKEVGVYYANTSNSIGISGVQVQKDQVSDFLFNITHSSTW